MEQECCTGARRLMPDSGADVLSHKLVGALKMDDRHEEMKSRVVSSRLSEEYEGHFHLTNAGAAVEQEASTGAQRLAPGLAAHVSGQLLGTLQMDDLHHEETKSQVISSRLSEQSEGHVHPSSGASAERTETRSI
uniref:Uncharacterized protein LOC104242965 n=1 Tax=Nicotiana sylvestris TaxID=4096 RepID=A0A1U7XWI5_NICSY|nr:PREDICTED: uncharacterized protein LOC104242965 [Nicotiana sylvestris]